MLRVEFELTIPVFERAKTVHALDRTANKIKLHGFSPFNKLHRPSDRRLSAKCKNIILKFCIITQRSLINVQ
jgi:hypothetical protein